MHGSFISLEAIMYGKAPIYMSLTVYRTPGRKAVLLTCATPERVRYSLIFP